MSEKKKESSLSLSAKAKKFDVPLSTLKKVFRRGVAAWNSGHRPGTTPQQWGHARVNSYLRKGKTYHTADKDLHEEALIKGTNCKNCIWWKEDTEQKVDKSELNENGGLKAPNEQYIKMSKHVDMVSLPGKATVSVKAFCDHDDVKNFVTERMCCAYWNGEGTKREFKGEADVLSEEQLNELDIKTYNKYVSATYSDSPAAQARKVGGPKNMQRNLGRLRARILKQKQIDKPENQAKIAQMRADHEALHNPNKDTSGRGYGEKRYMGDSVEIEDINRLFEMQLVGTDEYRQHAIAMTPGQDQEIEDAFPPEVYGTEVQEPKQQEESTNIESDGSAESADNYASGNSFRAIRKKLEEQEEIEIEDEKEIEEDEEEEGENDGAEDGVDFTPNLKTTKIKNAGPKEYTGNATNGFPVLGIAEENKVVPVDFKGYQQLKQNPSYDPKKKVGLDPTGQVWQKVDWNKPAPKTQEKKVVQTPFLQPTKQEYKQVYSLTKTTQETKPKEVKPELKVVRPTAASSRLKDLIGKAGKGTAKVGGGLTILGAADKAKAGDYAGAAADIGAELGGRALAKTAGKALLKKLPLIGAGIGAAAAYERAKSGDITGAAGEALSGLASTLPGAGTAASTAIDAALMARDIAKRQKKKPTLSEAVEYHNENNISLVENIFRPGSDMFFAMILEAKRQYAEGTYTPKDEFEQDLLESNIGEVAEYEGEPVLLDFPYEEELNEESDPTKGKGIGKPFRSGGGGAVYVRNGKGNIIKVNFSQSGMKKRYNEPARVKSFVARHHCYSNKDRTSASYWACRWPRYFSDSGQQWW